MRQKALMILLTSAMVMALNTGCEKIDWANYVPLQAEERNMVDIDEAEDPIESEPLEDPITEPPSDPIFEEYEGYQKQVLSEDFGRVLLSEDTDFDAPAPLRTWVELSAKDTDNIYKAIYFRINKVTSYRDDPEYAANCIQEHDHYNQYKPFEVNRFFDERLYIVDYEVYIPAHFESHNIDLTFQLVALAENNSEEEHSSDIKFTTVSDTNSSKLIRLYSQEGEMDYLEGGQYGNYYTLRGYYHLDDRHLEISYKDYRLHMICPPDGVIASSDGDYAPYDRKIPVENLNAFFSL